MFVERNELDPYPSTFYVASLVADGIDELSYSEANIAKVIRSNANTRSSNRSKYSRSKTHIGELDEDEEVQYNSRLRMYLTAYPIYNLDPNTINAELDI